MTAAADAVGVEARLTRLSLALVVAALAAGVVQVVHHELGVAWNVDGVVEGGCAAGATGASCVSPYRFVEGSVGISGRLDPYLVVLTAAAQGMNLTVDQVPLLGPTAPRWMTATAGDEAASPVVDGAAPPTASAHPPGARRLQPSYPVRLGVGVVPALTRYHFPFDTGLAVLNGLRVLVTVITVATIAGVMRYHTTLWLWRQMKGSVAPGLPFQASHHPALIAVEALVIVGHIPPWYEACVSMAGGDGALNRVVVGNATVLAPAVSALNDTAAPWLPAQVYTAPFLRAATGAYLTLLLLPLARAYLLLRYLYWTHGLATPSGEFLTRLTRVPYTTWFMIKSRVEADKVTWLGGITAALFLFLTYAIRNVDGLLCAALPTDVACEPVGYAHAAWTAATTLTTVGFGVPYVPATLPGRALTALATLAMLLPALLGLHTLMRWIRLSPQEALVIDLLDRQTYRTRIQRAAVAAVIAYWRYRRALARSVTWSRGIGLLKKGKQTAPAGDPTPAAPATPQATAATFAKGRWNLLASPKAGGTSGGAATPKAGATATTPKAGALAPSTSPGKVLRSPGGGVVHVPPLNTPKAYATAQAALAAEIGGATIVTADTKTAVLSASKRHFTFDGGDDSPSSPTRGRRGEVQVQVAPATAPHPPSSPHPMQVWWAWVVTASCWCCARSSTTASPGQASGYVTPWWRRWRWSPAAALRAVALSTPNGGGGGAPPTSPSTPSGGSGRPMTRSERARSMFVASRRGGAAAVGAATGGHRRASEEGGGGGGDNLLVSMRNLNNLPTLLTRPVVTERGDVVAPGSTPMTGDGGRHHAHRPSIGHGLLPSGGGSTPSRMGGTGTPTAMLSPPASGLAGGSGGFGSGRSPASHRGAPAGKPHAPLAQSHLRSSILSPGRPGPGGTPGGPSHRPSEVRHATMLHTTPPTTQHRTASGGTPPPASTGVGGASTPATQTATPSPDLSPPTLPGLVGSGDSVTSPTHPTHHATSSTGKGDGPPVLPNRHARFHAPSNNTINSTSSTSTNRDSVHGAVGSGMIIPPDKSPPMPGGAATTDRSDNTASSGGGGGTGSVTTALHTVPEVGTALSSSPPTAPAPRRPSAHLSPPWPHASTSSPDAMGHGHSHSRGGGGHGGGGGSNGLVSIPTAVTRIPFSPPHAGGKAVHRGPPEREAGHAVASPGAFASPSAGFASRVARRPSLRALTTDASPAPALTASDGSAFMVPTVRPSLDEGVVSDDGASATSATSHSHGRRHGGGGMPTSSPPASGMAHGVSRPPMAQRRRASANDAPSSMMSGASMIAFHVSGPDLTHGGDGSSQASSSRGGGMPASARGPIGMPSYPAVPIRTPSGKSGDSGGGLSGSGGSAEKHSLHSGGALSGGGDSGGHRSGDGSSRGKSAPRASVAARAPGSHARRGGASDHLPRRASTGSMPPPATTIGLASPAFGTTPRPPPAPRASATPARTFPIVDTEGVDDVDREGGSTSMMAAVMAAKIRQQEEARAAAMEAAKALGGGMRSRRATRSSLLRSHGGGGDGASAVPTSLTQALALRGAFTSTRNLLVTGGGGPSGGGPSGVWCCNRGGAVDADADKWKYDHEAWPVGAGGWIAFLLCSGACLARLQRVAVAWYKSACPSRLRVVVRPVSSRTVPEKEAIEAIAYWKELRREAQRRILDVDARNAKANLADRLLHKLDDLNANVKKLVTALVPEGQREEIRQEVERRHEDEVAPTTLHTFAPGTLTGFFVNLSRARKKKGTTDVTRRVAAGVHVDADGGGMSDRAMTTASTTDAVPARGTPGALLGSSASHAAGGNDATRAGAGAVGRWDTWASPPSSLDGVPSATGASCGGAPPAAYLPGSPAVAMPALPLPLLSLGRRAHALDGVVEADFEGVEAPAGTPPIPSRLPMVEDAARRLGMRIPQLGDFEGMEHVGAAIDWTAVPTATGADMQDAVAKLEQLAAMLAPAMKAP